MADTPDATAQAEAAVLAQYERLIHKLARQAEPKLPPQHALDHDDLFQEGAMVALKAFRCWNPNGKAKLITYLQISIVNRFKRLTNREWSRYHRIRLSDE